VFGKEKPEDSIIDKQLDGLTPENISTQVLENEIDYTVARKLKDHLSCEAKLKIANYAPVNTILWYYEELECSGLDQVLKKRLDNGEKVVMSYGKLMERLATLKELKDSRVRNGEDEEILPFIKNLIEIANTQLQSMSLNLESPVVVIGDKSGSMEIAIQTSNIIASLLTKMANADLVFFDSENILPPFIPKNVEEVMSLSTMIEADQMTVPAASLYPYYEKKEVVKTFVIVTDEGENGKWNNYNFAELFMKYVDEVYPATLVFISFSGYASHQMVKSLKQKAPNLKPLVFDFMSTRPDLSKLDNILGVLFLKTPGFKSYIDDLERKIIEEKRGWAMHLLLSKCNII